MAHFALKYAIAMSLLLKCFPPTATAAAKSNFTQLNCNVLDTTFLEFEECSMNRENVVNVRVKLFKLPVDNITIHARVMKYIDGSYRNYYFNNVYDICKIMRSKRNAFVEFLYQQAIPHTNFNHTCPFNETYFIVKNLRLDDSKLRSVKMILDGKYALIGTWMSNKVKRTQIELYFTWRK